MVATQSLMMMRLMVLVRREHRHRISGVTTGSVPTGIGNVIGNKSGLGIALKFIETSLCFVGSHLAARYPPPPNIPRIPPTHPHVCGACGARVRWMCAARVCGVCCGQLGEGTRGCMRGTRTIGRS